MKRTLSLAIFLALSLLVLSACSPSNSNPENSYFNDSDSPDSLGIFPFRCSDLVKEHEFQEFTGKSSIPGLAVRKQEGGNFELHCEFSHRAIDNESYDENFLPNLQLRVYASGSSENFTAINIYEYFKNKENTKTSSNESSNIDSQKFQTDAKDVSGIGMKAFEADGRILIVLSSNEKYVFTINSNADSDDAGKKKRNNLAMIIDSRMN